MYSIASYGGLSLGVAVSVRHAANPVAMRPSSFFGVHGIDVVFGGSRGRTFDVRGLLLGSYPGDLRAAVATLLSFADGVPRVLIDSDGVAWPDVVFTGRMEEGRRVFNPNGLGGMALEYRARFLGLT